MFPAKLLTLQPGEADPALLRALEEAINSYQQVVNARNAREKRIADLRAASRLGRQKFLLNLLFKVG
jgi:hypothetical protein